MSTASHAEMFITELFAYPELKPVLDSVPEVFIEQARQGATTFYLDNTLISRSNYQYENGDCDKIRIVLEDPFLYEDGGVAVRFRFSGIMDLDGELVGLRPGSQATVTQKWLRGFRSNPVVFNQASVDAGVITAEDLKLLQEYGKTWEDMIADFGENAPYTPTHSSTRLWLTAVNTDAIVTFEMQIRNNPQDGKQTVGIANLAWNNCKFIGKNTMPTAQPAALAIGVSFSKPTTTIPKFERGAGVDASRLRSRR